MKFLTIDWDHIRYFMAFVAAGTLSRAAKSLGVEHATVARRISSLEAGIGLTLVDRRGRRWTLTEDGLRVAGIAERMEEESRPLLLLARGKRDRIAGDVIISAPPSFSAIVLTRPLAELSKANPDLKIHLKGETHTVSVARREADIAIRLSRPEAGEFKISKLGEVVFFLVGQKDYIYNTPRDDWKFVGGSGDLLRTPQQKLIDEIGGDESISVRSDQIEIQYGFVKAGAGLSVLPDFLIQDDPDMIVVEHRAFPIRREVWIMYHLSMAESVPIRAVVNVIRGLYGHRGASPTTKTR